MSKAVTPADPTPRRRLIVTLTKNGMSVRAIATLFSISTQAVYRALKKARELGEYK